jgi:hypothetical protein
VTYGRRMPAPGNVTALIGIYHAEGSLRGEVRYLIGKWRGTAHCELCDITHGALRMKQEFAAATARLGIPIELVHLDERTPDVAAASEGHTPCVLARIDGRLELVLDAAALRECRGEVGRFETALHAALAERRRSTR